MNAREELVQRLAQETSRRLGPLSQNAYDELVHAVRKDPSEFAQTPGDEAELIIVEGLERFDKDQLDNEFLDDAEFAAERDTWLKNLRSACKSALAVDPVNVNARLIEILARDLEAGDALEALGELDRWLVSTRGALVMDGGHPFEDPELRARLRVQAALMRTAFEAGDYRMARDMALALRELDPQDNVGARFTLALTYARLEDETGFNALDQSLGHHGNAWSNLARTLLLFKLDRESAARRALRTFTTLNEGAAYVLLRPVYVERYLPDRPSFDPGSFEEVVLAVSEADPIVVDTPDFIGWAAAQGDTLAQGETYAERNDLEW